VLQAFKANVARRQALRVSMAHFMSSCLQHGFTVWLHNTQQRIAQREHVQTCRLRKQLWTLHACLQAWCSWAIRKRFSASSAVRALSYWTGNTKRSWFLEWHENAVTGRRAEAFWCVSNPDSENAGLLSLRPMWLLWQMTTSQ
jgi:hypothetical protein